MISVTNCFAERKRGLSAMVLPATEVKITQHLQYDDIVDTFDQKKRGGRLFDLYLSHPSLKYQS